MNKDEKLMILEEIFILIAALYVKEQDINRVNYLHHLSQNLITIIHEIKYNDY